MGRKRRKSWLSASIGAWLAVAQILPFGPLGAALGSEPAQPLWTELRGPQAAASEWLSNTDQRSGLPGRPTASSTEAPHVQQPELGALLAEHAAEMQLGGADFAWVADDTLPAKPIDVPLESANTPLPQPEPAKPSGQRRNRLDPELVRQGQGDFESSCTACHDAERATSKRKSLAGWLATVRRMAAKSDADVPTSQHTAIATYLASLNPAYASPNGEGEAGGKPADASSETAAAAELAEAEANLPPFTLNGTLSPVWRGTDPDVENKGFFPDVWVGIEWRPARSPVSGKVTACASCHGTNNGLGVELVEAAAILDLCHLVTGDSPEERPQCRTTADLMMGRFIVPFGAFSGRVHPGALRTVSLPLMYNMGRRVGPLGPGQPVINQPYSDEGVNLHLEYDLPREWEVTLDTYAVNGLQVGGPGEFFFSRSYRDNNSNVAVGGRATIGDKRWRFGGSIAGGELQDEGGPLQSYSLAGGDATYRHGDFFRFYYEYAIREEDAFPSPGSESIAYGNLIESEILILKEPKISFLARFDTLEHRGVFGDMSTERFTYGLNWLLPGGSLLILDHERWVFDDRSRANIFGVRWTTVF